MSLNVERIANLMQREFSNMLLRDVIKEKNLGFITITEVRVTNDLSFATIYYTVLGDEEKIAETQKALDHSKGFIRSELAKKIKARKMPDLIFKFDEALAYGNKINSILGELNK